MSSPFRWDRQWSRAALVFLPSILLLVLAAATVARQRPDTPALAAGLPHLANEKRHFYVTTGNYFPTAAPATCAAGYHMASLWEIFDTSTLTYARDVPGAKTNADQGSGPVSGHWGWVRTGGSASVVNIAGRANCNLWTSRSAAEYGTIVQLSDFWTASAVAISPWQAKLWTCYDYAAVWCVSDPVYGSFLPFMVSQ